LRDREADTEQAELRKLFLGSAPAIFHEAQKIFGPFKIERVRRVL
jgi:hypothetical protein